MTKKRNIRDQFEEIYLRSNDVKRFMHLADQSVVNDKNFNKAINYIVYLYQRNDAYVEFFGKVGYDREDLRSIAMVWGLTFVGRQASLGLDPYNFKLMIRYVGQRMSAFKNWVVKKFFVEEVVTVGDDPISNTLKFAADFISHDAWLSNQFVEVEETEEESIVKSMGSQKKKAYVQHIEKNLNEYQDIICYYATTKTVSHSVRSGARRMCAKLNLNYAEWLKNKLVEKGWHSAEFSY
jgi:hypothetical protein